MESSAAVEHLPVPTGNSSSAAVPFTPASTSDFVWPVPAEELARVVFDNQEPERVLSVPSRRERGKSRYAAEETAEETAEQTAEQTEYVRVVTPTEGRSTPTKWWLPALLLVTGFESTYLGVRAVRDWRHSTVLASENVLPARPLVYPFASLLPRSPVELAAGVTSSQPEIAPREEVAPIATPQPGWISIDLPIQVEVYESGRFVGSSDRNRLLLSPGQHELELVNESLGFRSSQSVGVQSGHTTFIGANLPVGYLSLNAQPWSEVLIDGKPVGETPIANVELPIGPHRVLFKNPVLGEQTRTVVVASGTTTRVAIDMR